MYTKDHDVTFTSLAVVPSEQDITSIFLKTMANDYTKQNFIKYNFQNPIFDEKVLFVDAKRWKLYTANLVAKEDFSFEENDPKQDYKFLKNFSYVDFFMSQTLNVPICFRKSKSLRRKNTALPLLKFTNLLSKCGFQYRANKLLIPIFQKLTLDSLYQVTSVNSYTNPWSHFFQLMNRYYTGNASTNNAVFKYSLTHALGDQDGRIVDFDIQMVFNCVLHRSERVYDTKFFTKPYILNYIDKISPIFSYYIYSVDKNVRKFSRGRSGKYKFVWKYVAPYKRRYATMRWLAKDVKFVSDRTFKYRLYQVLHDLYFDLRSTYAYQSKLFSQNYVYRNFRKSLMSTLMTIK